MLLLQDFFDEFFKGSSASDRGTLCQLKNLFNFRNVKADISNNFFPFVGTYVSPYGGVCMLAGNETPGNGRS